MSVDERKHSDFPLSLSLVAKWQRSRCSPPRNSGFYLRQFLPQWDRMPRSMHDYEPGETLMILRQRASNSRLPDFPLSPKIFVIHRLTCPRICFTSRPAFLTVPSLRSPLQLLISTEGPRLLRELSINVTFEVKDQIFRSTCKHYLIIYIIPDFSAT